MKILLIILNLLAAVLVFPAMGITHQLYEFRGVDMYVELDRAQIINRDRLKEAYPQQFHNDRILLPKLFFSKDYPAVFTGVPCIIAFILNAVLIGFLWPKKTVV